MNCTLQVFQRLVVLLGSDANVVHTYAAVAVERLLAQKVSIPCIPLLFALVYRVS